MRYEVFGDNLPAVEVFLDYGESIYTQSGGMVWMTAGMKMETNMKGGLMKGIGRMFSGESLFMATYSAQAPGQSITLASTFPGHIAAIDVTGKSYICQKNSFLCAEPTVNLETTIPTGLKGGLFGGEGFIFQRISGSGMVFLELDGSVSELDLAPGEKLIVDTGNVAIYESTVGYSAEMVKGFANVLFGGEGLFVTTLTGPGKVYLQTMTMPTFVGRITPYLPKNK